MFPVAVILNPSSGRGKGRQIRAALEKALHQAGLAFDLYTTEGKGHAIELTVAAKQRGAQVVISVGGDGTVNEVVNGLLQASEKEHVAGRLAVLPIGTGNDFATTLGQRPITSLGTKTHAQIERLTHAIAKGNQRLIDVGWASVRGESITIERYFDNNMAAGLEAQSSIYSNGISGLPGRAIYTLAALRAIASYRAPDVQLSWWDARGEEHQFSQRSIMVSIGNNNRTGGGFLITPDALLDDGELDVAIVRTLSRPALIALLPLAMFGKHTSHPAVRMLRIKTLQIRSGEGLPVHMDGEVLMERATQIDVRILASKLAIVV